MRMIPDNHLELMVEFEKISVDLQIKDLARRKSIPLLRGHDRRKTRYFRGPQGFKKVTKKEVTPTGRERTY